MQMPGAGGSTPASNQWPPKLQQFVERAFKQCKSEYERECMQGTLKGVIQFMSSHQRLWSTDWDNYPLPRVANASGKVEGRTAKQQQMADAQKKKKRKHGAMAVNAGGDGESEQERQAREKRHRRFMDIERGGGGSTTPSAQAAADDDMKFISSEAIVGTCMEMEKMYIRLQSMPDPAQVRPERVLVRWAERLKHKYDTDEADWEWITDQFKAIRQDLHIQHIRNANAVSIYEVNARLALLEDDFAEFYKIQSYLAGLYAETGENENEPEFLSYRLFYWMLNDNTLDFTKDVRAMPKEQQQHDFILHARKVHEAVELSDYVTFFRLYEETPNLGKCIAKPLRGRIRLRALRVILRAYKPTVPLAFMQVCHILTSLAFVMIAHR